MNKHQQNLKAHRLDTAHGSRERHTELHSEIT